VKFKCSYWTCFVINKETVCDWVTRR